MFTATVRKNKYAVTIIIHYNRLVDYLGTLRELMAVHSDDIVHFSNYPMRILFSRRSRMQYQRTMCLVPR